MHKIRLAIINSALLAWLGWGVLEDKPLTKNQKSQVSGGLKLVVLGLLLMALPFALTAIDASLNTSEGANIGAGVLGLITFPVGFIILVIGIFRMLPKGSAK